MKKLLLATATALSLSGAGFSQMMGGMHDMMGGQGGMMGQPPPQMQPYQPYYYYYYPTPYPYMMMPMMPMHDPRWMVENSIRFLIYNKQMVREVLKRNPRLKQELKELLK